MMDLLDWTVNRGATVHRPLDSPRLNDQQTRVFNALADGKAKTLAELHEITGDPEASISARIRDLRKPECGGHTVKRTRRDPENRGIHEYRLIIGGKCD